MKRIRKTSDSKKPDIDPTKQMLAIETLGSSGYLNINKLLLSSCGPLLAVYIGNIVDKYKYFITKGQLGEDGSFFLTHESQQIQTGMSDHQLRKCKNQLKKIGALHTRMKGIPPKEFYFLDVNKLVEIYLMNIPSKIEGMSLKKLKECSSNALTNIKENRYKENKDKENKEKNKTKKDFSIWDELLEEWLTYKRSKGQTYKNPEHPLKRLKKLSNNDPDVAAEILDQSYGNNWSGMFPLPSKNGKPYNNLSNGSRQNVSDEDEINELYKSDLTY